jgi:hypothetical protein
VASADLSKEGRLKIDGDKLEQSGKRVRDKQKS